MNSLTTPPSQHAFKASTTLLSCKKPSKSITDPDFRTYNPDIFPSLSPFSNFYNKKKQNEARASRNCSDDLEPVKKYKLDNGSTKFIPQSAKLIPSPISPKAKEAEKDCFRVPHLPKRLCEKKSLPTRAKVAPITNFKSSSLTSAGEFTSFVLEDNQENVKNVKFSQPMTETVQKIDNQNNENFHSIVDASLLNNLYERFRLEFLLLQYGQQANRSEIKNFEADMNMEDMIVRSKDLLKEQIKKTEIDC
jgi:hypothetical protein